MTATPRTATSRATPRVAASPRAAAITSLAAAPRAAIATAPASLRAAASPAPASLREAWIVPRDTGATALVWSGGAMTYGELFARAGGAAADLDAQGVARDARVAVVAPKSVRAIVHTLGCLLSGRPVLLPAPELPRATIDALLEQAAVEHVVDVDVPPRAAPLPDAPATDGTALMLATSGSTGQPKLVPIARGAILRFADWAARYFDIGPGTRVLSYCGLGFDLSILELYTTLIHGGCVVLADPARPAVAIAEHQPEVIQGVPLLYSRLETAPSVRHAILTGEAAPMALLARLPGLLPNARLHNVYGCTETNDSFVHEIDVERELELGAVPLGEPIAGVRAKLVDEDGHEVAGEGRGELWVSTPFQADGYLGAQGGFRADGFYRSRDVVRRDAAGRLLLDGRTDSQVKIRGQRVNLQAVEQAMLAHADEVAAFTVDGALVAVLSGATVDTLQLRADLARTLGRASVPSTIDVQPAALPRTTTGKVDRNAVRAHWLTKEQS